MADFSDEELALDYANKIKQTGQSFDDYAEAQGDLDFGKLVRAGYEQPKTLLGGATDAIAQQYYTKKQGLKQGTGVVLGSLGMDGLEDDLLRSARRDSRKSRKYAREVFDDYEMIDDWEDFFQYFTQGASRSVVDIAPSMISSLIGRGIGGKIQKGLDKTDKFSGLKKKAKELLGEDYGSRFGMAAGALTSSAVENTGHVYSELHEYTKLDPSDEKYLSPIEARALSLAAGGVSGALDSALPVFLIGKLSKTIGKGAAEEGVGKFFKSMPDGMTLLAQGAAGEGITEALQEVVQMMAVKYHTNEEWNHNDWNRMVNGGLLGAIGGGTITGATAGVAALIPGQREDKEVEEVASLDTSEERINITNSYENNKFLNIEIGSIVMPAGSGKYARVTNKNDEDKSVTIEYFSDGKIEKIKSTALKVKEDSKKKIVKEDLPNLSEDKLEQLKRVNPNLEKDIDRELESRKENIDEDTKEVKSTQLKVEVKNGNIQITDLASTEKVYRANIKEVNGVLEVQNETLDASTPEREKEAQNLLHDMARAKAKEKGIPVKIGDTIEFPITKAEIEAIDDDAELFSLFNELYTLQESYPYPSGSFTVITDTLNAVELKMEEEGLIVRDTKGRIIAGDTKVNSNNSVRFRNSKIVADVLAAKIFKDLEGSNNDFTSSNKQTEINEKFILAKAKEISLDYARGIDGFNEKTDVAALAKSATELYSKHYLKDNAWKSETDWDKALIAEEEAEVKRQQENEAIDSFATNRPEVGRYVKLEKGDKLIRITEVNEDDFTFKTELDPTTSISASKILKVTDSRQLEILGYKATQDKDSITTTLHVTGSATKGEYKGRASVVLNIDENGKVNSFTHEKTEGVYDTVVVGNELGLTLESSELKPYIASQVLEKKVVLAPVSKVKSSFLGGGITEVTEGDKKTYTVKPVQIGKKIRGSKNSPKFNVTPIVDAETQTVSSFEVEGYEPVIVLSKGYEIKQWVEAAREAMKRKKLWGEEPEVRTPQQVEQDAVPSNILEFTAKGRNKKIIIPTAEITPIDDLDKEGDGYFEAIKLINSLEPGNSTATNKAVVFRYYRKEGDEPIYLVRTVAMSPELKKMTVTDKNGTEREVKEAATVRSVVGMKKKINSDVISPLTQKNGSMNFDGSKPLEALYGDFEDGPRLEIAEILTFRENARVVSDFSSEVEYREAIGGILDYDRIRTADSITALHEEVKDAQDDQGKRIFSLLNDGTKFNPVMDIFDPNISAELISEFKKDIALRAKAISKLNVGDPKMERIVDIGKKISIQKDTLRVIDIEEFMTHIKVGEQSGFSSLSEDGKYNTIEKALSKFADGSKVKKSKEDSSFTTSGREIEVDAELTPDAEDFVLKKDFRDEMDKYVPPSADDFIKVGQYYYPRKRGDREQADTSEFPVYEIEINGETNYVTSEETSGGDKVWFRYGDVDRAKEGKTGPFNIISDYEFQAESKKELRKLLKEQSEEQAPKVEEGSPKETDTSASGTPLPKSTPPKRTPDTRVVTKGEKDARKELVDYLYKTVDDANLEPKDRGQAYEKIKQYEAEEIDIANATRLITNIIENSQSKELDKASMDAYLHQSVGEIATSEEALDREINRHLNEPRNPAIKEIPLSPELAQENSEAVQEALGGAQIDGEPIRLGAYLDRIVMLGRGSSTIDGAILDMAQVLMSHPFAKNLKVQFRSWENFKDGIENDGSNGKITRAYVKGNTIVMGPFFKLRADDGISASDALQVTFLEEITHRVLGTAIEASIQAKLRGKLPRGASKVISQEQAVKFYDETKELMDWLRKETDGEYYHGLLNMHEFWANFASNPKFRKFLNRPMPPSMRRKFNSRFERVIDWILDLVSRLFDVDFTPNRTASDEIKKSYRTLLRTSDKLAANDVDLMPQAKMESMYADSSFTDRNGSPIPMNADGTITVYHRTDADPEKVADAGFVTKENTDEIFVSSSMEGQAEGYGGNIIELRVKEENLELDDEFDGEVHFRVGIETANNSIVTQDNKLQMESADTFDTDDSASIARGTLRAHMGAMKDLGAVIESVMNEIGDDSGLTKERLKEFITIDGVTTPDVVQKILGKKAKVLIEEAQAQFAGALAPDAQKSIEDVNGINELETVANRDTGARNLMNMLTGARRSVVAIYSDAVSVKEKAQSRILRLSQRMSDLTSEKTMFDASKTEAIFSRYLKNAIYSRSEKGEASKVATLEFAMIASGKSIKPTSFNLLSKLGEIDSNKLYNELAKLAIGYKKDGQNKAIGVIEELTTEEIFDVINITAADIGINNPDLDQAVQMGIASILGSDGKNAIPRSAFTTRLRLATNQLAGTSIKDAVDLIKAAAAGRPTKDIKDKSMRTIVNSVRSIKDDLDIAREEVASAQKEINISKEFIKGYDSRIADLDEVFGSSAPVELREGGEFNTLEMDDKGNIRVSSFTFKMGNGESSSESKYVAAKASELYKIMDTQKYKDTYEGTPEHRYFKQLALELRKPNFGIQYQVSNIGFIHSAATSLQERFSRLGPAGKLIASALNEYTRDYQAESGVIYAQGRKVSGALRRLHQEMSYNNGENLNQFITDFGRNLFDWFNERPDLQGQEDLAINKVWAELQKGDPHREYTETGRKALRAYLKQWSIQSQNFKRLYKKHNVLILDDDVSREAIAIGGEDKLYRNFVEQGVYTTPRKLNMSRVTEVAKYLNPKFDDEQYLGEGQSEGSFFGKLSVNLEEAKAKGIDFNESFTQSMGKLVDSKFANLFFRPLFIGKSAHSTPFTVTTIKDENKSVRIITPEEMERIWKRAEGENPGVRVANAILDIAKILPDSDESTITGLLGQFKHRANAILSAEKEARLDRRTIADEGGLSSFMSGKEMHTSIHARGLYNILPGEFFEYEMYDETSSGQHLSKILMTSKFGRKGEKLKDNYLAIRQRFEPAHKLYLDLSKEIGMPLKNERSMPSRTNKVSYPSRVKKMKKLMAEKGLDPSTFETLDRDARNYVEAQRSYAAAAVAFTSKSSDIQDISLGLEVLRFLAFGMVNTMKGAFTGMMSIPDIVKVLGLNLTAFKTLGKASTNVIKEVTGSFLESFGVEMLRPDKHNSELADMFGRQSGSATFSENISEIGKQGDLNTGLQGGLRKTKNIVNALSVIGGKRRSKTGVNYVPASLLTAITAPFTYLAQVTNKSISLAMASTIESFVLKAVDAHDAKNLSINDNLFEVKPTDLGYEDSKLDSMIFGSMDMVEKLNLRLTSEGMSFSQLAQDYRRRRVSDPDTRVLSSDAVLAAHNIAMSEVTYDTMSGKGSWALGGAGQYMSPLVGWSFSSYAKGMDQMRNKEGRMAWKETIRYMLTSTAWLLPVGIAFTLFTDWWDEEILGKPSSLRKVPLTAALPFVGLPLAISDPRFEIASMIERSMRANNILGIGQEFLSPILVGQLDPSSMASRFDPTRRVLGISTVMNLYSVAMNYSNAIRTSNGGVEDLIPDYSTVVRPLLYATGLNSVVQNAQAITNLTDLEELDPTGFLSSERQSADITGMRNSLRIHAKVMGMEMRKGGIMQFTTTAMSNAVRGMERTAYANDKEGFKKFYRKALALSDHEDARKHVAEQFKKRHLKTSITRFSLSDLDLNAIMSVLDKNKKSKLQKAFMNHDYYLRSIGGIPKKSRSDTRQYNETLRRLAL